jgi:hypothetical protein
MVDRRVVIFARMTCAVDVLTLIAVMHLVAASAIDIYDEDNHASLSSQHILSIWFVPKGVAEEQLKNFEIIERADTL